MLPWRVCWWLLVQLPIGFARLSPCCGCMEPTGARFAGVLDRNFSARRLIMGSNLCVSPFFSCPTGAVTPFVEKMAKRMDDMAEAAEMEVGFCFCGRHCTSGLWAALHVRPAG